MRPPPSISALVVAQFAFLSAAFGFFLPPFVVFGVVAALSIALTDGLQFGREVAAMVTFFLSMAITISAWPQRGNSTSTMSYFMSVPVRRPQHALMRTAAGWSTLMAAGATLLTFAYLRVGGDGIPLQGWIAPLVGATTTYMVFSGLYAGTRHPSVWLLGLLGLPSLVSRLASAATEPMLDTLAVGRFGLVALFMGGTISEGPSGTEAIIPIDVQTWLLASFIWLSGGLAVLAFGTLRRWEV